jgi:hypothetical protein
LSFDNDLFHAEELLYSVLVQKYADSRLFKKIYDYETLLFKLVDVRKKELLADIAPADYTDAAIDIINDAVAETTDWKDKMIQFGSWALVVVFSLIAIIIIANMVKNGQAEAKDLILQAGTKGAEACKEICRQAVNIAGSTAP